VDGVSLGAETGRRTTGGREIDAAEGIKRAKD